MNLSATMHPHQRDIALDPLVRAYDHLLLEDSEHAGVPVEHGYANLGYWTSEAQCPVDAARALAVQVAQRFTSKRGPILDVGCGLGATTAVLADCFRASDVYGINISERQLDACRRRLPLARFFNMRAEALGFADNTFRAVSSIEAALHFRGRGDFLREALRVLKPGGELVVADMLFHRQPQAFSGILSDQELYADLASYNELWLRAGFVDVETEDVTKPVWRGFVHFRMRQITRAFALGQMQGDGYLRARAFLEQLAGLPVTAYTLTRARKP